MSLSLSGPGLRLGVRLGQRQPGRRNLESSSRSCQWAAGRGGGLTRTRKHHDSPDDPDFIRSMTSSCQLANENVTGTVTELESELREKT
jgi:hypothetical protein